MSGIRLVQFDVVSCVVEVGPSSMDCRIYDLLRTVGVILMVSFLVGLGLVRPGAQTPCIAVDSVC